MRAPFKLGCLFATLPAECTDAELGGVAPTEMTCNLCEASLRPQSRTRPSKGTKRFCAQVLGARLDNESSTLARNIFVPLDGRVTVWGLVGQHFANIGQDA